MDKCQFPGVLKALVALLFVSLAACSSNSERAPASTGQWFSCQAAESRSGWNCREGNFVDSTNVSVPAPTPMQVIDSSTVATVTSEPQVSNPSPFDQESAQLPVQESEPEQVQSAPEDAVMPETSGSSGEQIIEEGLGVNYSIQLAAFTTEERRESYLGQTPIDRSELILERGQRDGQNWWLVLHGRYQNYQQALEAQEYLVSTYGVRNTWIKPLN